MPVYQSEKFVLDTLNTVVQQSLLPCELIIVDDGSTDRTCQVIESFMEKHNSLNVKLLRHSHKGPGYSRNIGIRNSSGSWIAFLDSDDLWFPSKLERMAFSHRMMPEANILCHNEIIRYLKKPPKEIDYSLHFNAKKSLPEQLFCKNFLSTSAVICTKELIITCSGFDENLSSAQDYDLWLRMASNMKILFVKETLGVYIERKGNISSGSTWPKLKNILKVKFRNRDKVNLFKFITEFIKTILIIGIQGAQKLINS